MQRIMDSRLFYDFIFIATGILYQLDTIVGEILDRTVIRTLPYKY